jgi:hypothetical protein
MQSQQSSLLPLESWLVENVVPTGGWSYYDNKTASVEPTCLALLALKNSQFESSKEFVSGIKFLESCVQSSGMVVNTFGIIHFSKI